MVELILILGIVVLLAATLVVRFVFSPQNQYGYRPAMAGQVESETSPGTLGRLVLDSLPALILDEIIIFEKIWMSKLYEAELATQSVPVQTSIVQINSLGPESSFAVQFQSVYLGAFVPELAETGSLASLGLIQSETGGLVNIEASGASPSVSLVVNQLENPDCISNLILNAEGFMVNYGLPGLGEFISINSSNVAIFMGDPSVGSSMVMTPESITLKVGEATMTLTAEGLVTTAPAVNTICDPTSVLINAEGITEVVGETVREMNEEGHTLTAAETEMNVGVEGLEAEVPTHTLEADGSMETNTALFSLAADGMQTMEAPIAMQE